MSGNSLEQQEQPESKARQDGNARAFDSGCFWVFQILGVIS